MDVEELGGKEAARDDQEEKASLPGDANPGSAMVTPAGNGGQGYHQMVLRPRPNRQTLGQRPMRKTRANAVLFPPEK
ncbi:hypothetical protein B566_EDAN017795 [Ephemera danica]|nr:hypothetical protein B566_EDAN017795 [Ephemera danica]